MDRFNQLNLYSQQTDGYFVPEDKYRPLPWRVAAGYVGLLKAPFQAGIGIGKAYLSLAGASIMYHYVYHPGIWRMAAKTGELRWVGFPGFRGFARGPYGGPFRRFGHRLFGQMVRPFLSEQAYMMYQRGGLMGVATYLWETAGENKVKRAIAQKVAKVAAVLGGYQKGGETVAKAFGSPIMKGSVRLGRIGRTISGFMGSAAWGAIAYDVVRGTIALTGSALNKGLKILDRVHTSLVRMRTSQLPEAYRMPQAATLRSLALQEIHASRTNVRSVLLGNEAAYLHRA